MRPSRPNSRFGALLPDDVTLLSILAVLCAIGTWLCVAALWSLRDASGGVDAPGLFYLTGGLGVGAVILGLGARVRGERTRFVTIAIWLGGIIGVPLCVWVALLFFVRDAS